MSTSTPKSSRAVTFCIILFMLAVIPMFIGNTFSGVGTISFMQIMAAGVALGVMITAVGHHLHSTTKQTA